MGQPAARIGDMHVCPMVTPGVPPIPHVGGPILPLGVPTVLIGGLPAAVVGNMCTCVGPPDSIVKGSMSVFIGGRPAARVGDVTTHGGTIVMGCPTVLIGDILTMCLDFRPPCAVIQELKKEPTTEAEKQKQVELQKELDNSVKANLGNIPPDQRVDVLNTAEHYQKTSNALDKAKLSNAAYGFNIGEDKKPVDIPTPLGYKKVEGKELEKMGLNDNFMNGTDENGKDNSGGFKAAIYESTTGKEPKYTVAFAGTEVKNRENELDLNDVFADGGQGIGMRDKQYAKALILGDKMRDKVGPNGFTTTGHSLGGGLASAVSAATKAKGTTFNAAGLHKTTKKLMGLSDAELEANEQNVDSYQNTSCPLSMVQNNRVTTLTMLAALAPVGGTVGGTAAGSYYGAKKGNDIAGPIGGVLGSYIGAIAGTIGGAIVGVSTSAAALYSLATDGLPKAYGKKIEVPGKSKPFMGHGIGEMIEILNEQTQNDLDKLKKQFGCP